MNKLFSKLFFTLILLAGFQTTANANQYETLLKSQLKADGPGMAVIVQQKGKTLYSGAYGMANMELGVPLNKDSVFRLGSITKQFTSAAIMMLQEQGKLSVDDDIHKYAPDFPVGDNKVTLVHLMTHTSGINNYTDNEETMHFRIQEEILLDDMLKLFAKEPMLFATGENMRYSNTGYVLLGKVIEVASGQSYAEFIEKNIFEKLGMKQSQYGGLQIVKNRANGYSMTHEGVVNAAPIDMSWPHAAGSLISTVGDLAIWNEALVNGKVVSKESYQQMITPFKLNNGDESPYGFGLGNFTVNKYRAVGHAGGINGFSTNAMYIAEEDLFVAVFSNNEALNPRTPTLLFAAEALGIDIPDLTPVKVSESKLNKLTGTFKIDEKSVRKLFVENGKVYTQRDDGHKWEVIPMSDNGFYYDGSLTYFVVEEENGKMVMNFYSALSDKPVKAIRE